MYRRTLAPTTDEGTPVPDDEEEVQERLTERFSELEEDQPDNVEDISRKEFGQQG